MKRSTRSAAAADSSPVACVQHVEVLAAEHLGAHRLPRRRRPGPAASGRQAGRAQHVVGPGQRQVAEQHRGGCAERARPAAPSAAGRAGAANGHVHGRRPRRIAEASIRSSCTSAHAWISSSALTARSTASVPAAPGSPPAPRQPHQANVGRIRLPPPSTKSASDVDGLGELLVHRAASAAAAVEVVGQRRLDPPAEAGVGGRHRSGGAVRSSTGPATGERCWWDGGHRATGRPPANGVVASGSRAPGGPTRPSHGVVPATADLSSSAATSPHCGPPLGRDVLRGRDLTVTR